MFFKRIESVGFKSFATKTNVELMPGVTVIVGPNGCGKSNILDAIKWVLGDQSAKSMRGKRMNDVIFAGSASFKPMGLAQVTLTLDNSRRTLDMDYDEVQITRRLFRTGESEYQINKVPCRLKDIHNLFLGTGIGTSAYSVLEQGRVDRIINAKAIDRRAIFEEAAGIAKYRARRNEAQRKLERTADDLARLNDLIAEIERQVGSLKRQANKAERYKAVSDELHQSERELLVLRSADLRGQLKAAEVEIADLEDRGRAFQAAYAKESAAEEEGKQHADRVDRELTKKGSELYQAKTQITELEHQVQLHKDRMANGDKRLEQIQAEVTALDGSDAELRARMQELEERTLAAVEEEKQARAGFDEKQKKYDELEAEANAESGRLDELNRKVNFHRDQVSRCANEVRIAEALIARHEETAQEIEADIHRISTLGEGLSAGRDEASRSLAQVEVNLEEKRKALGSQEIQFAETRGLIADLTEDLANTHRELHQREARLSALEELKASFEGFREGVRDIMERAAAGGLAGIVSPLANKIKSQPELERALEAALGAHLQDVLVDDMAAARAAMDYLVDRGAGKATFWPLGDLRSSTNAPDLARALAQPGVVGHAADLVEFEAALEPIVRAVLGGTLVVENLDAALGLAAQFPALSFVTLGGQILSPAGSIGGGVPDATGLLGREREIEELHKAVAALQTKEATLQAELTAKRDGSEALQSEIDGRKADVQKLMLEKARLQKDLEAADQSHREAQGNLERRTGQLEEIRREIETKRTEIEAKTKEREREEAELTQNSTALELQRERTREHSEDFIARGAELAEARAEIDKVAQRITHLDENRSSLEREVTTQRDARSARDAESTRIADENRIANEQVEILRKGMDELFETRNGLEKHLAEDEAKREEIHIQLKQMSNRLEQLQRDDRSVENELHEKRVREAEFRTNLGHLSEQAEEKFQQGLLQIAEELGEIEKDPMVLATDVAQMRQKIDRMGAVNMEALEEYEQQSERLEFLTTQRTDLIDSKKQIEDSIATIDETTKKMFHETFEIVRKNFIEMFRRLFNGGKADLVIEQEGDDPLLDGGVEIYAQPPGKKLQTLSLMSGGEKAMTAISLLFALFLHKPAPFAILDEIDAPLDDVNVERFKNVVAEFAKDTQFVIITHNKQTMELADAIYGVTMEESGVSKLVSVRFEHAELFLEPVG